MCTPPTPTPGGKLRSCHRPLLLSPLSPAIAILPLPPAALLWLSGAHHHIHHRQDQQQQQQKQKQKQPMMVQQQQQQLEALLHSHTSRYAGVASEALQQLLELWADQEIPPAQQAAELAAVIATAEAAWSGALTAAHEQQQRLRDSIQASLQEISDIKRQLGAADAELHAPPPQTIGGAHRTLRAWQLDVHAKTAHWQAVMKQRLADHADLEARTRVLRSICGLPVQPRLEAPNVSGTGMELCRLELQRLAADKVTVLRVLLRAAFLCAGDHGEGMSASCSS